MLHDLEQYRRRHVPPTGGSCATNPWLDGGRRSTTTDRPSLPVVLAILAVGMLVAALLEARS
jgi:hypothetical protein